MIFMKEPFFHGHDNMDQLVKIAKVLGTNELYRYLSKFEIELDPQLEAMVGRHEKQPWQKFINSKNSHLANPTAIDFLNLLLKYNPNERILPKEAMDHSYFQPVKEVWTQIENKTLTIQPGTPAYATVTILKARLERGLN